VNRRLFAAYFDREEDILAATRAVRDRGYEIMDVFTPYALHGLDRAMGLKPSRLPLVCLFFALLGATAKLWFQIWTSASDWPLDVGGKPLVSIPAFVPVTFEITVLFAGLGTVAAFFLVSRLFPGRKRKMKFEGATNDRFVLVLVENDAAFDPKAAERLCSSYHCVKVEERIEEAR